MKKKIVLLGDGAVGKTSLVRRYVEKKFDDDYIATIGVNVKKKVIKELNLSLSIWDIYGQRSISPGLHSKHYRGADGAFIVFDFSRKKTFDHLNRWIQEMFEITGEIPLYILGNKYDLIKEFRGDVGKQVSDLDEEFHRYMVENHYIKSFYSKEPSFIPVHKKDIVEFGDKWSEKIGSLFGYLSTSAKTGLNVEKAFHSLGKKIIMEI
ncbi:MAG: Rab family GTPase [Candidatus Saliniplasma sp.]